MPRESLLYCAPEVDQHAITHVVIMFWLIYVYSYKQKIHKFNNYKYKKRRYTMFTLFRASVEKATLAKPVEFFFYYYFIYCVVQSTLTI